MADHGQFYITTPIYYVNARPHIGHIYTTTICDMVARYHRLKGDDVFFLTGTDEHGKKVADAAREQEVSPQAFADNISGEFQAAFDRLGLTNDDFIRTTQPRHEQKVQHYVRQLIDKGDVELGEYEGWYDPGQEEYVTETNAREQNYKSAVSGRLLERVKETNYFFRLSKYQDQLLRHIEAHPQFIQPQARRNEVVTRIKQGLHDVAISRTTEPWGVPMPDAQEHSIYVWIDALFNYRSAIDTDQRLGYWPAQIHMIGKEILWFHAVIWPAMHMALGWPLPGQIYAHSFWISEGQKMSKTLGNFIDLGKLDEYISEFSLDSLRYYLVTQGPMGASDADFSHQKYVDVYNADLANTVGNSFSRIANMTKRYFDGKLPPKPTGQFPVKIPELVNNYVVDFDALRLEGAISRGLGLVRNIDNYIEQRQPFKLAKDMDSNRAAVEEVLYNCAEAMRIASILLWPIMPQKMEQLHQRLGCDHYAAALADHGRGDLEAWTRWGQLETGTSIQQGDALFPRHQPT